MKTVVIVGGGTAGWITACYLNAKLNQFQNGRRIRITLLEPEIPNRIGVGEATIPTLLNTLQVLGISEKEFMQHVGATFKQGIKFIDWLDKQSDYYHVFDRRPSGVNDDAGAIWAAGQRLKSFAKSVSSQPIFCEKGLSPKGIGQADYQGPMAYAYHIDAEKFADLLSQKALACGVQRILASVVAVERDALGNIAAVIASNNFRCEADLFIDCTGFNAELIGKQLGVPFVDFSPWLMCDRAVTLKVPYDLKSPAFRPPYTQATALSSGWAWDIPLRDRRGVGYVYASQFISDGDALQELIKLEGPHAKHLSSKLLSFQSGHRKVCWQNNCVAIGLSAGFLEPLESTGLYLVEFAAALLCEYFPQNNHFKPLADQFNRLMDQRFEEILNFIALHYCLTKRTDSEFWREAQKSQRIPAGLQNRLDLWAVKTCSFTDFHDATQIFGHLNYEYILYGMNFRYPFQSSTGQVDTQISSRERYVAKETAIGITKLPSQDLWLSQELGSEYALDRSLCDAMLK